MIVREVEFIRNYMLKIIHRGCSFHGYSVQKSSYSIRREYPVFWGFKLQLTRQSHRAPDKVPIFISIHVIPISSPNPMFDHLLESSHRDDSNKWSNIGFGEESTQVVSIEV